MDTTTKSMLKAFINNWIWIFGFLTYITTDRAANFSSAKWELLCRKNGISTNLTSSYHPQLNGLVEPFHRHLKDALRACRCETTWAQELPLIMLALHAAPHKSQSSCMHLWINQSSTSYASWPHQLALDGLMPPLPWHAAQRPVYLDPMLTSCTHV